MEHRSETSHRNTPRRMFGRIVGAVAALLALVAVAALAFSQTATFRDWLRRQVVARANAALNGRVEIGTLEGSLLGSLTVTDLRVTMDDTDLIAVKRVAATYNLLALITNRQLLLNRVAIDGIRLRLVEDQHGWNAARLFPPSAAVEGNGARAGAALALKCEALTVQDGSLDIVRPDARYAVRQLTLHGAATVDQRRQGVRLEALSFVMPDRDLRVERIAGQVERADDKLSAEDIVVKTAASSLRAHAQLVAGMQEYDVRADVDRLSADEVHRLVGGNMPATDVSGSLQVRGPARAASLDGTALKSAAGTASLTGTIDLADEPYGYDLRLELEHLDASGLLGPAQPKTNLSGTVHAKGKGIRFEQAAGTFNVALDSSSIRETIFERLSAEGTIDRRRITLDARAKTNAGNATVTASANIASQQYDLHLKASRFDPMPFLNRPGLSARISGTVALSGSGFEPKTARATAQLAIGPSQVAAIELRKLDGALRLADSQLTIERLALDSNVATADASGSIDVQDVRRPAATAAGRLQYSVHVTDLRPLARLGRVPAQGSFTLNGTASGRLDALSIDSTLVGKQLAARGTRIDALHAQLKAQGIGTSRGAADLSVHAKDVLASGRRLAAADVAASWKQAGAAQSAATVELRIRQDEKHEHTLRAHAEIAADESRLLLDSVALQLGDETWKNTGVARIVRRGERLAIAGFDLRSDRGEITVAGEGGTTGRQDMTVTVRDVDLAPFVSGQKGGVKGRLSAHAHLAGTASDPQIDADVVIDQPTIETIRYETVRVDLHLLQGSAAVNARVAQSGESQLVLDARCALHTSLSPFRFEIGEPLSGTLRAGRVDLAFLDPLLSQVSELRGTLTADLSLSGPLRKPEIRGPLSITEARAYVVPLGLKYDPVELRMRFDGSSARLEMLRILSGDGSLSGSGTARLGQAGVAGNGTFQLNGFPLFENGYGEGRASGWLWVGGSTQAPIVEGSIETNRLVFRIPEKLPGPARPPDPTITVVGPGASESLAPASAKLPVAEPEGKEKPGATFSERATVHLEVNVPHNAWLRRSDADIELRGWITAWKKPEDPIRVAGEINTVRGWYTFQGKKFSVSEGQVTLTGQDVDPLLNIVAVHQAGDYTVRIRIGGKLTQPTIKLESDPPMEQADILSVLLFGKPANKLNQGEARGLRERALGVASGYAASEFRQSVADALGVDNLEVEPGTAGLGSASATVGKYVTEDIFVSISHKFAHQNIEQLSIQYFLTPQWLIETATDTRGDSGVDIFWKWRY